VCVCVGGVCCVCERAVLCFSGTPVYLRLQKKNFIQILLKSKYLQNPDFKGKTNTDFQTTSLFISNEIFEASKLQYHFYS